MFAARFFQPVFRAARPFASLDSPLSKPTTFHAASRAFNTCPRIRPRRNGRIWEQLKNGRQQQSRGRQAFNYQRFQGTRSLFLRWSQQPTFKYQVGGFAGLCGGFYIVNLETVPVSGRRRFNVVSPENEQWAAQQQYEEIMKQYGGQLLPAYHPQVRMVQRVADRLIPSSGLEGEEWEVHVIQDEMENAFVIPGGKIFVFSGILDVCKNDDGLAAVLGHEIAHNVAHHAAERMSQSFILLPVAIIASFLIGLDVGLGQMAIDLAFLRPGSRSQESEADYIGLMMMSQSCYDPQEAVNFWGRMEEHEKNSPPQFLSTHPSNHNRMEKMRIWLHDAEIKRENSDCGAMRGFADDIRRSVPDFARF